MTTHAAKRIEFAPPASKPADEKEDQGSTIREVAADTPATVGHDGKPKDQDKKRKPEEPVQPFGNPNRIRLPKRQRTDPGTDVEKKRPPRSLVKLCELCKEKHPVHHLEKMLGHCCLKCKKTGGKQHGKSCTGNKDYVAPSDPPSTDAAPSAASSSQRKVAKKPPKVAKEDEDNAEADE